MKDISNLLSQAWGYIIYIYIYNIYIYIYIYLLILINYFAVLGLSRFKEFNRRQDIKNSYDIQFYAKFL